MGDAANVLNSWWHTNNSFLGQMQHILEHQNKTIFDQNNLLNLKETKNSTLRAEQKKLKAKLEETKNTLGKVQKEKEEMQLSYASLEGKYKELLKANKIDQVAKAMQSRNGNAKRDKANKVLQTVVSGMKNSTSIVTSHINGDNGAGHNKTSPQTRVT